MKKIIVVAGGVVFSLVSLGLASAQTPYVQPGTTDPVMVTSPVPAPSPAELSCTQKAVEVRETAIIAAHDEYARAMKVALEQRKTALVAAWGITARLERWAARRAAWEAFRVAKKAAHAALRAANTSAWQTFHVSVAQNCKLDVVDAEPRAFDTRAVQLVP